MLYSGPQNHNSLIVSAPYDGASTVVPEAKSDCYWARQRRATYNLNNYFDFHVCLSFRRLSLRPPSVRLCVCPKSSSNSCSLWPLSKKNHPLNQFFFFPREYFVTRWSRGMPLAFTADFGGSSLNIIFFCRFLQLGREGVQVLTKNGISTALCSDRETSFAKLCLKNRI